MRVVHFEKGGVPGIAIDDGAGWRGVTERENGFPGTLPELIAQGADLLGRGANLLAMPTIDLNAVRILPPVPTSVSTTMITSRKVDSKSRPILKFSRATRRVSLLTVNRSGGHANRPRSTMRRSSPW